MKKYFRKYSSLICLVKHVKTFLLLGANYLKGYLNIQSVSTSGYSRVELVTRAFSASEMNLPIDMSSAEQKQPLVKDNNQ